MNKKLGNNYRLASAGLMLSGVLGFASSSYGTEEAVPLGRFELKIVQSTTGGDEILAGNFSGAIGIIRSSLSLDSKYNLNNNLCAAYTAQGEFSNAEAYCQTAVHLSSYAQSRQKANTGNISTRSRQAMALNNFGVWYALQGKTQEASEYFEAASRKSKQLATTTERNMDALEQRMAPAVLPA